MKIILQASLNEKHKKKIFLRNFTILLNHFRNQKNIQRDMGE